MFLTSYISTDLPPPVFAILLDGQDGQDLLGLLHKSEVESQRFDHPFYLFRGTVIYVLDISRNCATSLSNTASDTFRSPPTCQPPNPSSSTRPPSQLSGQPTLRSLYGISQVAAASEYWAKAERDRQVTNLKLQVRLHGGAVAEAMGQDVTHVVLFDSCQSVDMHAAARLSSAATAAAAGAARSAAAADETMCADDMFQVGEGVGASEFVTALVASCSDVSEPQLQRMKGLLESGDVQVVGPRCVRGARA